MVLSTMRRSGYRSVGRQAGGADRISARCVANIVICVVAVGLVVVPAEAGTHALEPFGADAGTHAVESFPTEAGSHGQQEGPSAPGSRFEGLRDRMKLLELQRPGLRSKSARISI